MFGLGMIWAMLGPRSILMIVAAVLLLYGRSGVWSSPRARTILPWLTPSRRPPASAGGSGSASTPKSGPAARMGLGGDRTFWFFTIMAATVLAAWIVTRTLIMDSPGTAR